MAEEKQKIFREKSLQRISSPETLDRYVRTTSPSVVVLLVAVALLLTGFLTWSIIGKIETSSEVGFVLENFIATSYIKEEDYLDYIKGKDDEEISQKMFLQFDDVTLNICDISSKPTQANESTSDAYLLHTADIAVGDWYYTVKSMTSYSVNGKYAGKIVFSKTSPIKLFF